MSQMMSPIGDLLVVEGTAQTQARCNGRGLPSMPGSVGSERVAGLREKGDQRLVPLSAERGTNPLL